MTQIKAVFFDQDGVIIDTERDGHRVSFNMTFKEFGFTDEWDVEYYHELLQIAGGKERMKHHWKTKGFSRPLTEEEIDSLVKEMHKRKTAIFVELIESGKLPLRPGIHRFMKELMDAGIKIGVCTTSNETGSQGNHGEDPIGYQVRYRAGGRCGQEQEARSRDLQPGAFQAWTAAGGSASWSRTPRMASRLPRPPA